MGELHRRFYVESITSGNCVRLEPVPNSESRGGAGAGTGMSAVIIETTEATAASAFWKTAASCGRFEVIIREAG